MTERPDPKLVRDVFDRAMELDPDRRDLFIDETCDGRLREEVRSLLLAASDPAFLLLQHPGEPEATVSEDDPAPLAPGNIVGGFEIIELLGEGGMGIVYRARDPRTNRGVTLKLLRAARERDAKARERFRREAQAASRIDHANVGTVYAVGDLQGRDVIVGAYYEGETLAARLRRGPVPLDEIVTIVKQVGAGLAAIHDAGVVHRDLKPGNVLITPAGQVKILDFGLASLADPAGERLTSSGVVMGTVAYMAPEQARGDATEASADVWALGAMTYEMLSGKSPFDAGGPAATLERILMGVPEPLEGLRPDAPVSLRRLVERLLDKRAERRPRDGRAVLPLLDAVEVPGARLRPAERPGPVAPSPPFLTMRSLATGDRIGAFEVVRLLGMGGAGAVYEAVDTRLGRAVALKLIRPGRPLDDAARARLLREGQAVARLDHPNLGTLYEVGEHDGWPFLVMALHHGETLADRLRRGPLSVHEVETILAQITSGLAAAHRAGLVHRDLKPSNVMLTGDGPVKILDFGLAKSFEAPSADSLTASEAVMGTIAYMSPEQARCDELDARTDVWALGVIAYEMLAGRPPFDAPSGPAILARVLMDEPPALTSLRKDAPRWLSSLVVRMLSKKRAARPRDGADVLDALIRGAGKTRTAGRLAAMAIAAAAILAIGLAVRLSSTPHAALPASGAGLAASVSAPADAPPADEGAPSNLVANGSFEEPAQPLGGSCLCDQTEVPGWKLFKGGPSMEIQNHSAGDPFAGNQLAALDGRVPSGLFQDIPTETGSRYEIRFAFSPEPFASIEDNALRVTWGGREVATAAAGGNVLTDWMVFRIPVVADSAITRLAFEDVGLNNGMGTYLDGVSVTVIGHRPATSVAHGSPAGRWRSTAPMATPRAFHTAAMLEDGRVLVAGGSDGSAHLASAEIYDPPSNTWQPTGAMTQPRKTAAAARLHDGRVLVAGGANGEVYGMSTAEIYDPRTGAWSPTGSMSTGRAQPLCVMLPSKKVLVAGGWTASDATATSELYDPSTGDWARTGPLHRPIMPGEGVLLPDGHVLVAGGFGCCGYTADGFWTSELYDAGAGSWSFSGNLQAARSPGIAVLLPDGHALAAGGVAGGVLGTTAATELYDPATGAWSPTCDMTMARGRFAAVVLRDGRVLAAGGGSGYYRNWILTASTEIYDPRYERWTASASMSVPRATPSMTLLADGSVLVAGGLPADGSTTATATTEVFTPPDESSAL